MASRSMLELIGDILDIARIETGHLSLSLEQANLHDLLASVARVFEGLARDKGLLLQVELDPMIDRTVLIDPLRLKQVVSNLLGNAIKFTATGQVRLGAQGTLALSGDHLNLKLFVEDTGIGISAEDQQRLFNPFYQGSNNDQSARSGSGLGLVISRNLCEMMDGQLHLSSVQGKGTRVDLTLTLALAAAAAVCAPVTYKPAAHALNLLVVDDYPANRLLLARQLSFLGHHIVTAQDGAEGLALWEAGHFDGVITDSNMPIMDGYTLARDIRAQERRRGLVPCLLLGFTANAQPEETERCRQAGMDGCLFKPTGLDDLRTALATRTTAARADQVVPVYDLSTLITLTGGDTAGLNELLMPLLGSLAQDRALLAAMQHHADFAKLHDLAHRVKGGARMVKAQALIACCETLEGVCERGDRDALAASVEAIGSAMDSLHHSLGLYIK